MQQHDPHGPPATEDLPDPAWTPPPLPALNARSWGLILLERFGFWIACAVTVTVIGFLFLNADQISSKEQAPNPTAERGQGASTEAPDAGVPGGMPLSITTEPVDAAIFIDGAYVGVSPLRALTLIEGRHLIAVLKPSYAPLDTFVTLGEAPASLHLTLRNAEPSRSVTAPPPDEALTSTSDEADPVDREQTTPAPVLDEASTDTEQADLEEAPAEEPVVVEPPAAVVEEPAAADESEQRLGTLRILVKPWGAIYIDGTLHKSESSIWYAARVPPGAHRVRVEHPSLGRREQVVAVAAGEEHTLTIDLNEDP